MVVFATGPGNLSPASGPQGPSFASRRAALSGGVGSLNHGTWGRAEGSAGQPVAVGRGPGRPSGASSQLGRRRGRRGLRAESLGGVSPTPDTGAAGLRRVSPPRIASIPTLNSALGRLRFGRGLRPPLGFEEWGGGRGREAGEGQGFPTGIRGRRRARVSLLRQALCPRSALSGPRRQRHSQG